MKVFTTWILLIFMIAGSQGRLLQRQGESTKVGTGQNLLETTLKDLVELENPINPRSMCDVNYVKVGCFKDQNHQVLNQELFQDLQPNGYAYSGHSVNWADYGSYLTDLGCRCAKAAQNNGYTHFGLQQYAHCYSAADAARHYSDDGSAPRGNCVNQHYLPCDDNAWGLCVSKKNNANYVYKITEESSGDGEIGYGSYDSNEPSRA